MAQVQTPEPVEEELELPPTEDELLCDDGEPMETQRHVLQMLLLIESLQTYWKDRPTGFVGGNMFLYFSLDQLKNRDFRGPDFFAVRDAVKRERKSWVVWQEGGRGPDVVIELLSSSTAAEDKGPKKLIYQNQLRVPEYFWYHPFSGELAGFTLDKGLEYRPLEPDEQGRLVSQVLELALIRKDGAYQGVEIPWLRFATLDGRMVLTGQEMADEEKRRADDAEQRAEQEKQRADDAEQRAEQEKQRADRLAQRMRQIGLDPDELV